MNRTDVLTGRIVQRVIDEMNKYSKAKVVHGVDRCHNLSELMDNLWLYFPDSSITFKKPDSSITFKKLKYGYELKIEVEI